MKPRSNTLFHFTKNENVIFEIFKSGFWPKYSLEDIQWQGFKDLDFIAFPMVCFCDIPLGRISDHIGFYGEYGLGLTKEWAERNNLNPLIYVSVGSDLNNCISKTMVNVLETFENNDEPVDEIRYLIAYTKPTEGRMIIDGKPVKKEFYQESEWRYVPRNENITPHINRENHDDIEFLDKAHLKTKEYTSLKFTPNDVSYVFVPKDSDIPNIINFMQKELDHYPSSDLKVLFSRVVSIESINRDM